MKMSVKVSVESKFPSVLTKIFPKSRRNSQPVVAASRFVHNWRDLIANSLRHKRHLSILSRQNTKGIKKAVNLKDMMCPQLP